MLILFHKVVRQFVFFFFQTKMCLAQQLQNVKLMTILQVTITLNFLLDPIRANSSNRNISHLIIHLGLIFRLIVNDSSGVCIKLNNVKTKIEKGKD